MKASRWIQTGVALLAASAAVQAAPRNPNIVLIYADDLGYGDVSCYGATALQTPRIDRLAAQGLRFTDAHAASATCTPSRYALLTGEYAFRQKGTGVLPGDAALIIKPGRTTLPSMLKNAGYRTGVVGKWHLGLGESEVDWNAEIKPGPQEIGFDESFIMAATGDRVPTVFVKEHRVVGLDPQDPIRVNYKEKIGAEPTGAENPELLAMKPSHGHNQTIIDGISRIGYMSGGKAARWKDEELSDTFTRQAVQFIERQKENPQEKPFFLYFAAHEPHVPRVPHPRFVGKTGMGPRGDAIAQFDWAVGQVMDTLERLKMADNTLVILTSDNGPVVNDGYFDDAIKKLGNHKPSGPWRGGKYSNFEGGTRVPFIVRWPNRVKIGQSAVLLSQVDLLATFATLTGQTLPTHAAPDSINALPALLGQSPHGREHLVEDASLRSLRVAQWKYIPAGRGTGLNINTNTETGNTPDAKLYDLANDPGETKNLALQFPERVKEMADRLTAILASGRSRP